MALLFKCDKSCSEAKTKSALDFKTGSQAIFAIEFLLLTVSNTANKTSLDCAIPVLTTAIEKQSKSISIWYKRLFSSLQIHSLKRASFCTVDVVYANKPYR